MRQIYNDKPGANNDINKISFYSTAEGFIGFSKWVGFTTDSGKTFTKRYITPGNVNFNGYPVNLTFGFGISGVHAIDGNQLIVYGDYGFVPAILYSIDQGVTFKLIYQSVLNSQQLTGGIMDMVFPENNTIGFAVEADRIIKTIDGGQSWFVIRNDPNSFYNFCESTDNLHVFAFSTQFGVSKLIKTADGGATWQTVNLPSDGLNYAYFNNASTGWVTMNNGGIYYTTDAGNSWTKKNNEAIVPYYFNRLKFVNDSTGYATGVGYDVYKTSDSGKIWEPLPRDNNFSYLNYSLTQMFFGANDQFWAGGGQGFLEITGNAGGPVIPRALFTIDTTNLSQTGIVNLINQGKTTYTYKWYKNDTLISTAYNTSYTHNVLNPMDSIKLVVVNGSSSDSLTQTILFTLPVDNTPRVLSFTPSTANTGTTVTINGLHFSGASNVQFGGIAANSFVVVADSIVNAKVGNGASGNVSVTTSLGTGSMSGFVYLPPPAINSFTPVSAGTNTTVTITGNYFTGATSVSFGGINTAFYTVVSSTIITAVVGTGANGNVSVTTPNGTGKLGGYIYVSHAPVITGFSPLNGPVNTIVTISGINFSAVPTENIVYAGPVRAKVLTATSNSLTIQIPAGTTYSPLRVTTDSLTAYSSLPYTLTYPGGGTINQQTFEPNKELATGTGPVDLFMMDIDGDGKTDITTCQIYQPGFNVLRNTSVPGKVSFAPYQQFTTGLGLTAASLGDIDGDGKPDLVLVDYYGGQIIILKNTSTPGNISFVQKVSYPTRPYPYDAVIRDIDGDGRPDITVAIEGNGEDFSNKLCVYRNTSIDGIISFSPRMEFAAASSPITVWLGDVNGDGKPDIVSGSGAGIPISVLRNTSTVGSISFAPAVGAAAEIMGGTKLGAGDLDGDGLPDIALGNFGSHVMSVYKNTSTPDSISFGQRVQYQCEDGVNSVTISDVDGDGKPDIVMSNQGTYTVSVYKNTSSGGTLSFAPIVNYPVGQTPNKTEAVGDLDGDGRPDIAVPNYASNSISVLRNNGNDTAINVCTTTNIVLPSGQSGTAYQWQELSDTIFRDMNDVQPFSGVHTSELAIQNVPFSLNEHKYRCISDGKISRIFSLLVDSATVSSIIIQASDTFTCAGKLEILTATIKNGGALPFVQWLLNGIVAYSGNDNFSRSSWVEGDRVTAILKSNAPCQLQSIDTSNTIIMHVNPITIPLVTINSPDTVICINSNAIFTASSVNAGTTPVYRWQIDGADAGTNSPVFSSTSLSDGNKVNVIMTSSAACTSPSTVTSNTIEVKVNAVTAAINITGTTTLAKGTTVLISSATTNAGSTPAFIWQDSTSTHSWQNINAATGPSINYQPSTTGDKMKCLMNSSAPCAFAASVSSNTLVFTITPVTAINPVPAGYYGIKYYPNPVNSVLTIDSLQFSDQWETMDVFAANGSNKIITQNIANKQRIQMNVEFLPSGYYIAILNRKQGRPAYLKFIKQ